MKINVYRWIFSNIHFWTLHQVEPAAPKLTVVFQWNPKIEVESNDFTENLLDTCNFRMLLTLQGKLRYLKVIKIKLSQFKLS